MNGRTVYQKLLLSILASLAFVGLPLINGCATAPQARAPQGTEADGEELEELAAKTTPRKGGAQLWSERCTQCHYARDASTFSQQQWEIIMLHMRVRANLTAADHQAILEFFKSAN